MLRAVGPSFLGLTAENRRKTPDKRDAKIWRRNELSITIFFLVFAFFKVSSIFPSLVCFGGVKAKGKNAKEPLQQRLERTRKLDSLWGRSLG